MKTKEATLKEMRRMLVPGTPAFLYQVIGTESYRWCSEASPMGEVCQKALQEGQAPILASDGTPMKGLRGQALIIHMVERVQS